MLRLVTFLLRAMIRDWPRRLSSLFTLLLLYSFVSWFGKGKDMWWPETVHVVTAALVVLAVLEFLPRLPVPVIRVLQMLGVIAYTASYTGYKTVFFQVHTLGQFDRLLYENVNQMSPYLWFALGAWAVYVVGVWWTTARWRIVILTGLSVLTLAVADSFSTTFLWKETAGVILSGLGQLIVFTLGDFRRKNPEGWSYLADYPSTLLATIAVLIFVTMVPGTMMPEVRPIVMDPYTAFMNWSGKNVSAPVGKGFDINPISSGNASSGYSRNDSELGGAFDFDYAPVMHVSTSQRSYWRGETLSRYTGRGWVKSEEDKQADAVNADPDQELEGDHRFDVSRLKTVEVKQTVAILSKESYPVLFGAFPLLKIETLGGKKTGFEPLSWASRQSELRWNEKGKPYPATYQVVSEVPLLDEKGLRSVKEDISKDTFRDYLQLPDQLPQRVKDLAASVTAGGATPYDKVRMLEAYLQKFKYTNKPDVSKGTSDDFVDRFLFEIQEGYCDYFSTSMVVMTRSLGIPARWVKGYSSGTNELYLQMRGQIPDEAMRDPDGAGTYVVRNSDAHSWAEVYFPGYGWIPFEATSGFRLPTAKPPAELPDLPLPDLGTVGSGHAAKENGTSHYVWIVVTAILAIVGIVLLWRFRGHLHSAGQWVRSRLRRRTANLNQQVVLEVTRLIKKFKRKGYPVLEHETVRETMKRWKKKDAWLASDLEEMLKLFEKAKYSKAGVNKEECDAALRLAEKLRRTV